MAMIVAVLSHIAMIPSYISFILSESEKEDSYELRELEEKDGFIKCYKIDRSKNEIFKSNSFWSHRHICLNFDIWPYQVISKMIKSGSLVEFLISNKLTISKFEEILSLFYISGYNSWNPDKFQISNFLFTLYNYSTKEKKL